jgi:hypothetical protein
MLQSLRSVAPRIRFTLVPGGGRDAAALGLAAVGLMVAGLASGCASEADVAPAEDDLVVRSNAEYFYDGPLPALESPSLVVSLKGHTLRVSGLLPAALDLTGVPHVSAKPEGTKQRVSIVYPIATARPGKTNSRPGTYTFESARPFRPDGTAVTASEGEHFVPWGGFPFLGYNDGIAFHGPITDEVPKTPGLNVWFLKRGAVSGGCNRMMGEHVVELAHMLGVSMRKLYPANQYIKPPAGVKVVVSAEYDTFDGLAVDVDYPTDVGVVRPAVALGSRDKVKMFGSWIGTETPDGKDLPADKKWEGGTPGDFYEFAEHRKTNWICSVAKADLPALGKFATSRGGELPKGFCAKSACVLGILRAGRGDVKVTCGI